jgi:chromosome segregation ATPase
MGKGSKFIIIGLFLLLSVAIFFLLQFFQQRQALQQSYNEVKEKLNVQTGEWSGKLSQLKSDGERLQAKAGQLEKEVSILTSERGSLQEKYDLIMKEKQELVDKLQAMATAKKEAPSVTPTEQQPTVAESDAYWAGILKAKADLELQLSDLKDVLGDLQIKLDTVTKEKNELGLKVSELEQANQDLGRKADYNERLAANLSADLLREQKDKQGILNQLDTIRQENISLRARIKDLDKTNLALKEKVKSIEDERVALEGKVDQMDASLDQKLEEVAKVTKEIKSLSGKDKATVSEGKDSGSSKEVELPPIVVKGDRQSAINDLKIITGKIVAINEANNFVVINLGENHGITIGRKFEVYRNNVSIGRVEVIQARKNISAADIISVDAKHKIRINDTVK